MSQRSEAEIFNEVRDALVELFEIDVSSISLDSELNADLDLDSIDAVDLISRLQQVTGKKLHPSQFQSIRTVGDIVKALSRLLQEPA